MILHSQAASLPAEADLVVIGAGPAGLAAATTASAAGAMVLLLDENPAPGGQIWRNIGQVPLKRANLLGPDYRAGEGALAAFQASNCQSAAGASVWGLRPVDPRLEISLTLAETARVIHARAVILATGAMERPMPLPGWTLPGVMGAGAVQTLLKSAGMVPDVPSVLVGSGPLLYLLGSQLIAAGAPPKALVETAGFGDLLAASRHLPGFIASPLFAKGLGLYAKLRRKVPIFRAKTGLRIEGQDRARGIAWDGGAVAAELVVLHHGVVPVLNLSIAAGCQISWDAAQSCFRPLSGADGASSVPGVFLAGDGAGIAGAAAASQAGQLAAFSALAHLQARGLSLRQSDMGQSDMRQSAVTPEAVAKAAHLHRRATRGRAFLDRTFPPMPARSLPDETVICRCEELTAGQIRAAARLGPPGPNQLKTFLRAGMGPCQGRMCGLSVTALMAETQGRAPDDIGHFRSRSPIKPLRLAALAALPAENADWQAAHSENLEKGSDQ